jgi:hypothetical protein
MGGHVTQKFTWPELIELYLLTKTPPNLRPNYNLCPTASSQGSRHIPANPVLALREPTSPHSRKRRSKNYRFLRLSPATESRENSSTHVILQKLLPQLNDLVLGWSGEFLFWLFI